MATYNRKDRRLIEDWGGVNTAVVIPDGQFRWYDGVTGYNAAEVIELVGNGSTTIASLPKRQPATDGAQTLYGVKTFNAIPVLTSSNPTSDNQAARKAYVDSLLGETFDVVDTDGGDVAATTPTSPANGEKWIVFNSGTSGNHVTGLPNSITLGDLKTLHLKYDDTNTQWIYEDVIIDEYTDTSPSDGSMIVRKWSGGKMAVIIQKTSANTATITWTYPEAMTSVESYVGTSEGLTATAYQHSYFALGITSVDSVSRATNGTSTITKEYRAKVEGRWKAGI